MTQLSQLIQNTFVSNVLADGDKVFSEIDIDITEVELPDLGFNEFQFYIHRVGFYLTHCLTWCKQLDAAVEYLSNFDYSKKLNSTRADHLIYNIENYFIRLNSVYDRILQIASAVFHLCLDEENVSHSVVISNLKITHRPGIRSKIQGVRKFLKDYAQRRNTLIHKHSWRDVKLRRIELLYIRSVDDLNVTANERAKFKSFRAQRLKEYVVERKNEFIEINEGLAAKVDSLFLSLQPEYVRQKQRIESSPW